MSFEVKTKNFLGTWSNRSSVEGRKCKAVFGSGVEWGRQEAADLHRIGPVLPAP